MRLSLRVLFAAVVCFLCPISGRIGPSARAQEIHPVESFVLAEDRQQALSLLVPGTDDFYFYHCLQLQHEEKYDQVETLLRPWTSAFGRTQKMIQIQHRQALLQYKTNPQQSLDYLLRELNLSFDHQRLLPDAEKQLPSQLDENLISIPSLLQSAVGRSSLTDGIAVHALPLLAADPEKWNLDAVRRQHLLSRLTTPDFPDLVDLIVTDMQARESWNFGELPIHRLLTLDQLQALAKREPRILNQATYVNTYLVKLAPNEDVDIEREPDQLQLYLGRMWDFAQTLGPVHNSLRANILYQQLKMDQRSGIFERDRFIAYLQLPKDSAYINRAYSDAFENRSQEYVDLEAVFDAGCLPPVINDQALVHFYLLHYLQQEADEKEFSAWVDADYLRMTLAEAKLTHGLGEMARWTQTLSPQQMQELTTRVDIDFAESNPKHWPIESDVELTVTTKNVQQLIVKVFELNAENYYRQFGQEIATDLSLDGLVPSSQQSYDYNDPPLLRKERKFKFPELSKAGVYVIDFIGNGISSRALIRKGRLDFYVQNTIAGQRFVVFDQDGNACPHAKLWMAGKEYTPDPNGMLLVPYSAQPKLETVVVTCDVDSRERPESAGAIASLGQYNQLSQAYRLDGGIHIDRESMRRGQVADLMIRPSLKLHGNTVPLQILNEMSVTTVMVDQEGIAQTQTMPAVLNQAGDLILPLKILPRTRSIGVTFNAKVGNITAADTIPVQFSRTFNINAIDDTYQVGQIFLLPTASGYFLEVRGKSGELKPGRSVVVNLQHHWFDQPVETVMATDATGRIRLGFLPGIDNITASSHDCQTMTWPLRDSSAPSEEVLHSLAGQPIVVPLSTLTLTGEMESGDNANGDKQAEPNKDQAGDQAGDQEVLNAGDEIAIAISRSEFSLFELRKGLPYRDCFANLLGINGRLVLRDLSPGDYQLQLKQEDRLVTIKVTQGVTKDAVYVGTSRILERRRPLALSIDQFVRNDQEIWIKVSGVSDSTRLHLFATRFAPAFDPLFDLAVEPERGPFVLTPGGWQSSFVEGRDIGEEMRYILDRHLGRKYPGNMLPRPSLLLNPWKLQDATNHNQVAAAGEDFDRESDAEVSVQNAPAGPAKRQRVADPFDHFSQVDFLLQGSVVKTNLVPSEAGWIKIPLEQFGDNQAFSAVAIDHVSQVGARLFLSGKEIRSRDLRLNDGLAADQHFAQNKEVLAVANEESVSIELTADPKINVYDDLGDVYRLYRARSQNADLRKFEFITQWSQKTRQEKQALYSEHACHEFHFFLYQKDRAFFNEIVLPYLENKFEKTFLDRWLLGQSVESYDNVVYFANLNVLEKILLAQQVRDRRKELIRHVNDQVKSIPLDRSRLDNIFELAISNQSFLGLPDSGKPSLGYSAEAATETLELGLQAPSPFDDSQNIAASDKASQLQDSLAGSGRSADAAAAGGLAAGGFGGGGFGGGGMGGSELGGDPFGEASELEQRRRPDLARKAIDRAVPGKPERANDSHSDEERIAKTSELNDLSDRLSELSSEQNERDRQKQEIDRETLMELREEKVDRFYRRLAPTSEWVESNYYHLPPDRSPAQLIEANRFWQDYANHIADDSAIPFVSTHFAEIGDSLSEMLLALAVLELPEKAPDHQLDLTEQKWTLNAKGSCLVVSQRLDHAVVQAGNTAVLVSENFFQHNDRYYIEDGNQYDKFTSEEFIVGSVYGGQVVLTNPTSSPQKLELLLQIPHGSVPVAGSKPTRMLPLTLQPYSTQTFEYYFYFPVEGHFAHYPAHVSRGQQVLATAAGLTFHVRENPAGLDTQSWRFVSQNSSDDQVYRYLEAANLNEIDLSLIAFRMKDSEFFQRIITLLENRSTYHPVLWSYALKFNDQNRIAMYLLKHERFLAQLGNYFRSDWIQWSPADFQRYEHREYWPLVNSRSHRLGRNRKILNPAFYLQYHRTLDLLSRKSRLSPDDRLQLAYYLFLQDRIDEALVQLGQVTRAEVDAKIQWDYLTAYSAMYQQEADVAGVIAEKYKNFPVQRWNNRFAEIAAQVRQINGQNEGSENRAEAGADDSLLSLDSFDDEKLFGEFTDQSQVAAATPSFEFTIQGQQAKVNYRNLGELTVKYYAIDLELLFSRDPFAAVEQQSFSWVKANLTEVKTLPPEQTEITFEIPADLANQNVWVEIRSGTQTRTQTFYSRSMDVQFAEAFGQLLVRGKDDRRAMSQVYVKVYAEMEDGGVLFFKDGYTDLRGRFDYVSQSNVPLDQVVRLAVLVTSESNGAISKIVAPPQE